MSSRTMRHFLRRSWNCLLSLKKSRSLGREPCVPPSLIKRSTQNRTRWDSARVGVGGSPESVIRAARLGIPMALAIIGGDPARFAPFTNLYRESLTKLAKVNCRSRFTRLATLLIQMSRPLKSCGHPMKCLWSDWSRTWLGSNNQESLLDEVHGGSLYVGTLKPLQPDCLCPEKRWCNQV